MNATECCLRRNFRTMAPKYTVQRNRSNEHTFMAGTAMANVMEELESFSEFISVVDEVVASMSMLCRTLSSTPLNIAPKRMVQLTSCEEQVSEVDEAVASEMFVKDMIKALGISHPLALNVSSKILPKVIDYCKYLLENRKASELMSTTTAENAAENAITPIRIAAFLSKFDHTLSGLMLAPRDPRSQSLLDLASQVVTDMITGEAGGGDRELFNIENDFTPDEEDHIRQENPFVT